MSYNTVGKRNLRKVIEQKASENPHKTLLFFEKDDNINTAYSYQQFDQMVNKTANALLQLGIQKGDKVNLCLLYTSDAADE